jgi:outer membrane protein OmpA-like peptidoglycan-associated protein
METRIGRYGALSLLLAVTTVGLTSGCASKKYVRTEVSTSANEITARMSEKDRELQGGIDANTSQITELSGVTREHTQQIASLDSGLKTTDGKAVQALTVGQGAQSTADQAVGQVSRLDMDFQNRNRYTMIHEESVLFGFGSATVDKGTIATLDEIAQSTKNSPNAILVLEGRTDSTGDTNYNILLGEKRLDAVVRYLVVEQDVPMQRIYKMSFGEARPVSSNDTREGRAQNRAVLIRLMEPAQGAVQGGSIVSDAAPVTR